MRHARTAHAAGVILSGVALALDLFDAPRLAIAALALVLPLFAWSLETLRHAVITRPENRP